MQIELSTLVLFKSPICLESTVNSQFLMSNNLGMLPMIFHSCYISSASALRHAGPPDRYTDSSSPSQNIQKMGKKKSQDSAPKITEQKKIEKKTTSSTKNDDEEIEIIEKFDFLGFFGLILFNIALFYGVMTCAKEGLTKAQVRHINICTVLQFLGSNELA